MQGEDGCSCLFPIVLLLVLLQHSHQQPLTPIPLLAGDCESVLASGHMRLLTVYINAMTSERHVDSSILPTWCCTDHQQQKELSLCKRRKEKQDHEPEHGKKKRLTVVLFVRLLSAMTQVFIKVHPKNHQSSQSNFNQSFAAEHGLSSLSRTGPDSRSRSLAWSVRICKVTPFVESENSPTTDPLVLWLNGGPGCSSLKGFLMEVGPYRINQDGKTLTYFKQRWNKIANMLFLESPVGVGFSYNDEKDYTSSDDVAASNNHEALRSFFKAFPEYTGNDFFVTGESYGGFYVPVLAARLVDDRHINFKGFAVGNPVTVNHPSIAESLVIYSYFHGFIDDNLWTRSLSKACCPDSNFSKCSLQNKEACTQQFKKLQAAKSPSLESSLNLYNYLKPCEERQGFGYPCINTTPLKNYLNSLTVRKEIHVAKDMSWEYVCSEFVRQNFQMQYADMTQFYRKVLQAGRQIVVYSGDLDLVCDFIGTRAFVDALNQPMKQAYKAWTYKESDGTTQVAGFVKQYQSLKFVLVKGSGHSVPTDKPQPAFDIFQRFLKNQDY